MIIADVFSIPYVSQSAAREIVTIECCLHLEELETAFPALNAFVRAHDFFFFFKNIPFSSMSLYFHSL